MKKQLPLFHFRISVKKLIFIFSIFLYSSLFYSCQKEVKLSSVRGQILNVTDRPIRDAEVRLYNLNTSSTIATSYVSSDGTFEINNVEVGQCGIEVNAEGYNTYQSTVDVNGGETTELSSLTIVGDANIQGDFLNSQTGYGVSGAEVGIFMDGNISSMDDADLYVTTSSSGSINISGAPVGNSVAMLVQAPDMYDREIYDLDIRAGQNRMPDQTLVETVPAGQLRVVLTWGASPADLDTHLTGPTDTGSRFHLYFGDKNPHSSVNLDVDDVTSYGPETTTMKYFYNGSYYYSVHNYSGRTDPNSGDDIASSPAVVEVWSHQGLEKKYVAPAFTGSGNIWEVFRLDISGSSANISSINQYKNSVEWTDFVSIDMNSNKIDLNSPEIIRH